MSKTVLVVTSDVPFVEGGHRVIAEELDRALRARGHRSAIVRTPSNRFGRALEAYLANFMTDVGETGYGEPVDHVISLRWPAYAVRHPRHTAWVVHRMREYYDLWERFTRGLGRRGRLKERVRRRFYHGLDRFLLTRNVTRLVAQSKTIQARLTRYGGLKSELVYPPAPERPYRNDGYGDYVFAVSRLHSLKRLDLLVEAAALVKDERLAFKIAGAGEEEGRLYERIEALGLRGRVELVGPVSEERLVDLYAGCRAVFFGPWNEDYGFVTLEAFRSAKAVVTTADSGGPAELVRHNDTGFVAAPTAASVAGHLDELARDAGLAERLGQAALATAADHTWSRAVERLLIE
jgi:glycosyltransferase involved in cell wall biosynthesis